MKSSSKIILGVLVVVVVLVFVYTQTKKMPEILIVISEDKGLMLQIPKDALPLGVSLADIKAVPYAEGEIPYALKDGKLTGYKLLPDGLVFQKPITAVMHFATENSMIPTLLHIGKDSLETIDNVHFEFARNADGKTTITASAPISHFSGIVHNEEGLFTIRTASGPRAFPIGVDIPFEFTIAPAPRTAYVVMDSQNPNRILAEYGVQPETRYQVNQNTDVHRFWGRKDKILSKVELPEADLAHDETYRVTENIRCSASGDEDYVSTTLQISYTKTFYYHPSQRSSVNPATVFVSYKDYYFCTAPTPTATPSRTSGSGGNQTAPSTVNKSSPTSGNKIIVCGLPGGPACPKRK